jgi:HK97 family phage major capsid protein
MNGRQIGETRAGLIVNLHEILDRAEADGNRALTAEERITYDKIFADVVTLEADKKRVEALEVADASLRQITPPLAAGKGLIEGSSDKTQEERRVAFQHFIRRTLTESEARALTQGSEPGGGYLVPDQFRADLIQDVGNEVFVRQLAKVDTITGTDTIGYPVLNAHMANAEWTSEVGAATKDVTLQFGKREVKPNKLQKAIQVSKTLLRNAAIDVEATVRSEFAYVLGITMEQGYLTGIGTNQPLGVFTVSANGIDTDRDFSDGNTATALTVDGLMTAKYALKPLHRRSAQWLFHTDAILRLSKLKDGEGRYIWSGSVVSGAPDTLLGLPVNESAYVPSTFSASKYVGMLANWSRGYHIVDSQTVEIQVLRELYAETGLVEYLVDLWTDGAPVLPEAFARIKLSA